MVSSSQWSVAAGAGSFNLATDVASVSCCNTFCAYILVEKHGWRRIFQQRKNRNLGPKLHFLQPEEVASSEKLGHIDICEQIDYDAVRMEIAKQEEATTAALNAAEELRSAFKRKEAPNDEEFIASVKADRPLLKEIRRGDTSACTSLSVLCKPGSDFSFALKLFQDLVLRPKKEKPSTPTPNLTKKTYGMPIIIIPNALTSIITMANAPHLLTRGEYF